NKVRQTSLRRLRYGNVSGMSTAQPRKPMSRQLARALHLAALTVTFVIVLAACGAGGVTGAGSADTTGADTSGSGETAAQDGAPSTVQACGEPVEGFGVTHGADGEPLPPRETGTEGSLL